MVTSEYLSLSWDELVATARTCLEKRDTVQLRQLDAVFHHRFLNQVRRGDKASKGDFIRHMLRVTESPEARQLDDPGEIQQLVCQWAHLDALMDALREDGNLIDTAERFVENRAQAQALLAAIAGTEGGEIPLARLAAQLHLSTQDCDVLLQELEQHNIVAIRAVDETVYVRLALVGRLMARRRAPMGPQLVPKPGVAAPAAHSTVSLQDLDKCFPDTTAQYSASTLTQFCRERQKSGLMGPVGDPARVA